MILDITNKKFGRLTAVKKLEIQNKRGCFFWLCKCDCGNQRNIVASDLIRGNNKSCGCLKKRHSNENPTWKGYGDISGERFYNFKKNAKKRNITFKVSIKELWELFEKQKHLCSLTGDLLSFDINADNIASLDRIDSNKGYVIDNLRWIRSDINYMKTDIPDKKFIELCQKVVRLTQNIG